MKHILILLAIFIVLMTSGLVVMVYLHTATAPIATHTLPVKVTLPEASSTLSQTATSTPRPVTQIASSTPTPVQTSNPAVESGPTGIFSASGASGPVLYTSKENFGGVLIRASWRDIEKSNGQFDFSFIDKQVKEAESHGKAWSLAVAGGSQAPSWLIDQLHAPYVSYDFHGTQRLPLWWNSTVQTQLNSLASALGKKYASDPKLALVYVTQMTSNGIEGHLQGVNMNAFMQAGYTDGKWEQAAESTAQAFAQAFPTKSIAFEVHDVNGGSTVPAAILTSLWNNASLDHRVGAGIWWLSGNTTYQSDLLTVLKNFAGPVYSQMIASESQTTRFPNGYAAAFTQAEGIHSCYIEAWEQDLENPTTTGTATRAAYTSWVGSHCK